MTSRLFTFFLEGADYGYVGYALSKKMLPNLARLISEGCFSPLATTCPADSSVAFAEILTGCNPGKHGIFDTLHRDPTTYMSRIASYSMKSGSFHNDLGEPTLCTPLSLMGVKSALCRLPCTFPAPPDADLVISGLGVPDIAGARSAAITHKNEADAVQAACWPEPNFAYAAGRIEFPAFLEMIERAATTIEKQAFEVLSNVHYDNVMINFEAFDRIAHAGIGESAPDAVHAALTGALMRFDGFLGQVMTHFPDASIFVASDHGFAPWKMRVNVNRWLVENGYMSFDPESTDASGGSKLPWAGVDWSQTKAYASGLAKIYINTEGREKNGIVPPGKPARELKKELSEKLRALKDPENGCSVFSRILDSNRLYWGEKLNDSADLVLCYNPGYRTDWGCDPGGAGAPVVSRNESRWLADHCGTDPDYVPGIFICAGRPNAAQVRLMDIAPTILRHFNAPIPEHMDGQPVLE